MESQKSSESSSESKEGHDGKQASSSSSPSHDFSFTISLHKPHPPNSNNPSFAVDLSPADDIFFHGHLLPLHLLSHLPLSPRSSTASIDSFTLHKPISHNSAGSFHSSNITMDDNDNNNNNNNSNEKQESNHNRGWNRGGSKSKSLSSIFGLTRGRKEKEDEEIKQKRKLVRLDVVHVVKRYLQRMVLFRSGSGRDDREKIGAYNSYSGNLSGRNKRDVVKMRGRRGEYSSAPASMRTSPTNSGLLLATSTLAHPSDSTMEDLQAAIQAAIAHCKNSIAKEDQLKC